jgi:hypothetical protein
MLQLRRGRLHMISRMRPGQCLIPNAIREKPFYEVRMKRPPLPAASEATTRLFVRIFSSLVGSSGVIAIRLLGVDDHPESRSFLQAVTG